MRRGSPGCAARTGVARYAERAALFRTAQNAAELSRQVPVDLEPDADLNEGRGAPGHCSPSLAFQSSNKLDRGTPSRKPPQQHWRTHTYSAKEFYSRPPQGLPMITPAPNHCVGKAHSNA